MTACGQLVYTPFDVCFLSFFKRDYDPAMAAYQQALLLDPDSVILKENIKKLKRAAAGSHQGSNVLKETSKERGSSGRKTQKSVANNAATERT